MAITKIPAAGFTGNNFRNIIINGDMSIAQRSTSVAGITGQGYNTIDRFETHASSLGTWTQSQSTDVPTGQGFATSLKMDCTTADASPSAGDFLYVRQKVEGQNLQYLKKGTANAESTTLSFWVKSNKTGTYIAELYDIDNNRTISNSYTISLADTWEKKTLTYAGDTTGAFGNDNGRSLDVAFWLGAGTTYTSGTLQTSWGSQTNANRAVGQVNLADDTANEWYITGVQLEAGTTASDFEFLPVDVNLGRCQRYFQSLNGATGTLIGSGITKTSTTSRVYVNFINPMRSSPTATFSTLAISDAVNYGPAVTSIDSIISGITSARLDLIHASGASALRSAVFSVNSTSGYLNLSSEL
jgi:hypothetical protein